MKRSLFVLLSTILVSTPVLASGVGINVTEQARPGVPQVRWTNIEVVDSNASSGKLNYEIQDWGIKLSWITNLGVPGTCSVIHNENQDNATDWNSQVNKRRYYLYRDLITNLKPGQKLFITSTFDNTATCSITLSGQEGS